MSLTTTEWKSEFLQHVKSGKATDMLLEWVAECALHAAESGDYDPDVGDELAFMERAFMNKKLACDLSTINGCNAAIVQREELINDMVGSLYPQVVRQEIDAIAKLRDRLIWQERARVATQQRNASYE